MAFSILRITKQKGGSVGASGHHNGRTRETPNADPARAALNRLLAGEDRDLRELVSECIEERGGKPRRDSVEAVEFLMTASPEFFLEADPAKLKEKIDRFCERAVAFLEDPRVGGIMIKVTLHLDERTPHIHAHKVPYTEEGKLSAKHFFGTRAQLSRLQDVYNEYMAPLGLERGKVGSRARHQEVKKFYAAITQDPEFRIDRERLPDPPKVMLTREARDEYKQAVARAVMEQLDEDLRTLRHQAMLTRDERNKRVEVERRAAERVEEAERRAEMAEARLEPLEAAVERSGQENDYLKRRDVAVGRTLAEEQEKSRLLEIRNRELSGRVRDISMPEVMSRMGYHGEQQRERTIYRDDEGGTALYVMPENVAFDNEHREICRSSVDLVVFMKTEVEGEQVTREQAFGWLAENFGVARAAGAYLADRERAFYSFVEQQRAEVSPDRSIPMQGRDDGLAQPEHDPGRDDGGYSFGR